MTLESWQGYDTVETSTTGLRIAKLLGKETWRFDLHEIRNGMIIVDFYDFGLIGANVIKQIYSEFGIVVQALEPLDYKTRVWFGSRRFNEDRNYIHLRNKDKPTLGDGSKQC